MRSVYDNIQIGGVIAALGSYTGVIHTGPAVDTKGYNSAVLKVYTTTVGSGIPVGAGGSVVAVLEESTDNSTWTTATDVGGTNIGFTAIATTTAVITGARIEGLNNNRDRYLRAKLTTNLGGTASNRVFTATAVIVLGRAYSNPVDTATSNT